MSKPIPTIVGVVLAVAVGAVAIGLVCPRPERVSMTLMEYTRWPHGATLRLTNGTGTAIQFYADRNDTPAGSPVLCLQKTSGGWTNVSGMVERMFYANPRVLSPGQSVQFWIRIEPGALPKRVGTVCRVPQSKLRRDLQGWLFRVKQRCRLKPYPPDQMKVWCPASLYIPPLQQSVPPS